MLAFFFSPVGRFGRADWWLAHLISFVALMVVLLALFSSYDAQNRTSIVAPMTILLLVQIWVTFCVTVKRYHDRGKSGWWYLIQFIPIVGPIWALVELGFCSGDEGENEYSNGSHMDISEDLRVLQEMSGQQSTFFTASPYRLSPAPRTSGPPVFGKRV
jgi:uncharacterized membrane protein YhaH (DUF805 family)